MALRYDSEEIADIAVKILGQFVTQQSTSPRKIQLVSFHTNTLFPLTFLFTFYRVSFVSK